MTPEEIQSEFKKINDLLRRHIHDGIETEILGESSSSVSALELVSYNTRTDTEISIVDLDLSIDLQYQVIVQCRNVLSAGIIYARVNGDNGNDKHGWSSQSYHQLGAELNAGTDADTEWQISNGFGSMSHNILMSISGQSEITLANWTCASIGYGASPNTINANTFGGGFWNEASNLTSLSFVHSSGTSCDWKVWIYKSPKL